MDNRIVKLKKTACYLYGIKDKDFVSRNRARHLVDVRRMVYSICKDLLEMPWTDIGRCFKVNHATIIHHHKIHTNLLEVDTIYRDKFMNLLEVYKADIDYIDMKEMLHIIRSLKTSTARKQILKQLQRENYENEINTEAEGIETLETSGIDNTIGSVQ